MMNNGQEKKKATNWYAYLTLLLFSLVLFLTYDIIITNFLAYRICHSDPVPKTFIREFVEFPKSIYWEDNISPGFDEQDRLLMIRNYLDGVHLKIMALNGPDGSVFVYSADEQDWKGSRDIKERKIEGNYYETINREARKIAARKKEYTKQKMPSINYNVSFRSVPLTKFQRRYLWSDEVTITDNRNNKVIAVNRRLMRRWYKFFPDVGVGKRLYFPKPMCGLSGYAGFDHHVFSIYQDVSSQPAHMGINRDLYKLKGD